MNSSVKDKLLNKIMDFASYDNNCAIKSMVMAFKIIINVKPINNDRINRIFRFPILEPMAKLPSKIANRLCQIVIFFRSVVRII